MSEQLQPVAHMHVCPCGWHYIHGEENKGQAHICPRCKESLPPVIYRKGDHLETGFPKHGSVMNDGSYRMEAHTNPSRFRIYKLPGSGKWHIIDSGPGTPAIYVEKWRPTRDCRVSQNYPGQLPHTWLEVEGNMFIVNGEAVFL